MKKLKWASALLLPALLLAACTEKEKEVDEHATHDMTKTYVVATDMNFVPFEFEVDGEYTGIDIDIINAIAEDQGFKIKLSPMDFGGIIPALQAKQVDVAIAGMSITDDRKEVVDFTEAYFTGGVALAVKADNAEIDSLEDLKGKKVATKKGTVSSDYAESIKEKYGFETVVFDNSDALKQDVKNGNSQALFEDSAVIKYETQNNPELGLKVLDNAVPQEDLKSDSYGIAVLKGQNPELLKMLNDGLAAIKENGKYDEILEKYLGASETPETEEVTDEATEVKEEAKETEATDKESNTTEVKEEESAQ